MQVHGPIWCTRPPPVSRGFSASPQVSALRLEVQGLTRRLADSEQGQLRLQLQKVPAHLLRSVVWLLRSYSRARVALSAVAQERERAEALGGAQSRLSEDLQVGIGWSFLLCVLLFSLLSRHLFTYIS